MGSDRVWRNGKHRRETTHVGGANVTVSTLCVRDASPVLHPLRMPTPWLRRAVRACACERLRACVGAAATDLNGEDAYWALDAPAAQGAKRGAAAPEALALPVNLLKRLRDQAVLVTLLVEL